MKTFANNRLLWALLGVVLMATLAFAAISGQLTSGFASPSPSASPSAAASARPSAGETAAQAYSAALHARASSSASAQAAKEASPGASAAGARPAASSQPASSAGAGALPFLAAYQDPQATPAPNGLLTAVGLLFKLAIVLGLIYLSILGLRFLSNRGRAVFAGASAINVLEKTALAQNRELYLIDVADKILLLGATSGAISVLTEIDDPDAIEGLRQRPTGLPGSLPSPEPFLSYLKNVGEKVSTRARPIAAEVAAATPLKPADLLKRIERHRDRVRERTVALQEPDR